MAASSESRHRLGASTANIRVEVSPIGIGFLDQPDLPFPTPLLDILLTLNCGDWIIVGFEPNQAVDVITGREARGRLGFVLVDAPDQIPRHAEIERAVLTACHKVDEHAPSACLDSGLAGFARAPE